MKTGIIVARFQTPYLHEGHVELIKYVKSRNDRVAIFLGTTQTRLTKNNPLNFETRKTMVQARFNNIDVHELHDQKHNESWSKELDELIGSLYGEDDVVLYGSRDSFIQHYHGKYRTEIFQEIKAVSSTLIRSSLHDYVPSADQQSRQWREGIIYASSQRYPTSYQVVDVAVIDFDIYRILLGRKTNEERFRFIGGFVDVQDIKLEASAKREVTEECGNIETSNYKYISSIRIDDWRYRNTEDKIMTAFFCCNYIFGHPEPKDDIAELKWFSLATLSENDIETEHIQLFYALKKYLHNNY